MFQNQNKAPSFFFPARFFASWKITVFQGSSKNNLYLLAYVVMNLYQWAQHLNNKNNNKSMSIDTSDKYSPPTSVGVAAAF